MNLHPPRWTVLQRSRVTSEARDLREFFNPLDESEAQRLTERLAKYDKGRATYLAVPA